jgi:hypothetical protein
MKDLAMHLTVSAAKQILRRALSLKTTAAVKRFLAEQIHEIAPNMTLLDTA